MREGPVRNEEISFGASREIPKPAQDDRVTIYRFDVAVRLKRFGTFRQRVFVRVDHGFGCKRQEHFAYHLQALISTFGVGV